VRHCDRLRLALILRVDARQASFGPRLQENGRYFSRLDQKNTVTTQFELTVSIKQVRNKDEGPSATQADMWE